MPASVIAAARTPWAPRHTALADQRPEHLLTTAVGAAVERAGLVGSDVARLLVACDTGVGAQDLNLARRAVLALGWTNVPALTADGQGAAGLGLLDLATALDGVTVVAGVDASSMVPPGAGLVRDYGRPTLDEPELSGLESIAEAHGFTTATLDEVATALRRASSLDSPTITPIADVVQDSAFDDDGEVFEPLQPGGVVTARHCAPYADGAVAVVVGRAGGRSLSTVLAAVEPATCLGRLASWPTDHSMLLASGSAVEVAVVPWAAPAAVPSPLAVGSTPSCDGLRMLADAVAMVQSRCTVVTRGGSGQLAAATLAAA